MSSIKRMMRQIQGAAGETGDTELPSLSFRRRTASEPNVQFSDDHFFRTVMSMDGAPEEIRSGSEYIHVSSLIDYCARREGLAFSNRLAGGSPRLRRVMAADRIIWAIGRAVESHVRSQFVEGTRGEGIIGEWSCRCGQLTRKGSMPRTSCATCGTPASRYGEFTLRDDTRKVVGNPDLLYTRPDTGAVRVIEIKSMNVNQYKELTQPVAYHVLQAACYHRLLSENGFDPDSIVSIFYACKDFHPKPYKEFHVEIDDHLRARIADLFDLASQRAEWIELRKAGAGSDLPERLAACSSPTTTRAKNCSECVGCFSRNS
jgi:hypothetical protein